MLVMALRKYDFINVLKERDLGICRKRKFETVINGSRSLISRLSLTNELTYHDGCVNALSFNRAGNLLASTGDDLQVALWDCVSDFSNPLVTYSSGHSSNVFQAKFMDNSDDKTIVTTARDGQIRVGWLDDSGALDHSKRVVQHKGACHKVSIHPGSSHLLLSAGEDAVVYSIDLRLPKQKKLLTLKNNANRKIPLYSVCINPRNHFEFALSGRCEWARIYDMRKVDDSENHGVVKRFCAEALKEDIRGYKPNITCLMYNYNGTELVCSYNDEDIYLFDTSHSSESQEVHKYSGHRNSDTVKGVNCFGQESEYIVSGSDCGHIFIWDKKTEEVVTFVSGDNTGTVNVLEPHPTNCMLATSGLDHEVKLWQPVGEQFDDHKTLEKQMKLNINSRSDDQRCPDLSDNHIIFLMIRHLQRQRRREQLHRRREELNDLLDDTNTGRGDGTDDDNDSDDGDLISVPSDDDTSDTSSDEEGNRNVSGCIQT